MAEISDNGSPVPPDRGTSRRVVSFEAQAEEQYSMSVSQHYILTTEDKIRLCLNRHRATFQNRGGAVAPFTTLIAIVLALVTAHFTSPIWFGVFLVAAGAVGLWLIVALAQQGGTKPSTLDDIVEDLKGSGIPTIETPGTTPSETKITALPQRE